MYLDTVGHEISFLEELRAQNIVKEPTVPRVTFVRYVPFFVGVVPAIVSNFIDCPTQTRKAAHFDNNLDQERPR